MNGHSHWYAIRKINGAYLNLNSTLEGGPQPISDFYLRCELPHMRGSSAAACACVYRTKIPSYSFLFAAVLCMLVDCVHPFLSSLLQQMVMDGWTVFVVRGEFPQPSRALSDGGRGQWIDARSLIRRPGAASSAALASGSASSSASLPLHRQSRPEPGTNCAPI